MDDKMQQRASVYLIDQHIHELEQRLSALQEIIINLVSDGCDTAQQSELLLKMLGTRSALKAFRQELREDMDMRRCDCGHSRKEAPEREAGRP